MYNRERVHPKEGGYDKDRNDWFLFLLPHIVLDLPFYEAKTQNSAQFSFRATSKLTCGNKWKIIDI